MAEKITWAFFGTSRFSTIVLDEMKARGYIPSLIITTEDKPKGRKLILTPPDVKVWAEREGVPYIQPESLRETKNPKILEEIKSYSSENFDVFVVASYGKLLPDSILNIPTHKTLNVHPSLLPRLRGASPIQSAILTENETGVTIIRLDSDMDHGPILAQEKSEIPEWPPYADDLETTLGVAGGQMLAGLLPDWVAGKIAEVEQDHSHATFCKKIEKIDALLDLTENGETNLRKIRAYHVWPGAFFYYTHGENTLRIIVKRAHMENGELVLDRVIPEGKKEMNYADFLNGKIKDK
ncbi:MAG: methionyl-tRNA formyltransferase [Patescibacteria group bacterium]